MASSVVLVLDGLDLKKGERPLMKLEQELQGHGRLMDTRAQGSVWSCWRFSYRSRRLGR